MTAEKMLSFQKLGIVLPFDLLVNRAIKYSETVGKRIVIDLEALKMNLMVTFFR